MPIWSAGWSSRLRSAYAPVIDRVTVAPYSGTA
jgi:hypothetical protein